MRVTSSIFLAPHVMLMPGFLNTAPRPSRPYGPAEDPFCVSPPRPQTAQGFRGGPGQFCSSGFRPCPPPVHRVAFPAIAQPFARRSVSFLPCGRLRRPVPCRPPESLHDTRDGQVETVSSSKAMDEHDRPPLRAPLLFRLPPVRHQPYLEETLP